VDKISGTITNAVFKPTKNDPSKNTLLVTFAPDDGSKHVDFYANNTQMQAEVTANLHKHVTMEYEMSGKWMNVKKIEESEAPHGEPKPETQIPHAPFMQNQQPQQTRENSIETQVAVKAVIELLSNKAPVDAILAADTFAWIRARIPRSVAELTEKAPESDVVYANKAQLSNLKKYVKAKNDADLLIQAEGRVGRDLASLEELTLDEADLWLNEVVKR
jgi:hypothetical protein